MLINSPSARMALNITTPIEFARTFIDLFNLNGVKTAPAAQNPATAVSRSALVANPSRSTQRACVGIRDTVIRGLF